MLGLVRSKYKQLGFGDKTMAPFARDEYFY